MSFAIVVSSLSVFMSVAVIVRLRAMSRELDRMQRDIDRWNQHLDRVLHAKKPDSD